MASFGTFSFAQTAHRANPSLAVSLVVAGLTALVLPLRRVWPAPSFGVMVFMAALLGQWPVRGALLPVALAIGLYTVAATMRRTAALFAGLRKHPPATWPSSATRRSDANANGPAPWPQRCTGARIAWEMHDSVGPPAHPPF